MLWEFLTDEVKVLKKVTLRSQRETPLADVWQVDLDKFVVEPSQVKERCTTCQRIVDPTCPESSLHPPQLPRHDDDRAARPGELRRLADGPTVRDGQPPRNTPPRCPARSATRSSRTSSRSTGKTNCLVATPTLEMGVNIGALDMALMRNVPPRPSNYWQRAGRAGREERMAVVVTYCRRSNHDRYFFDDPLRLLGGAIEAPAFNLRNPLMVAKHIRSAILSELLLRSTEPGETGERVKEVLERSVPDLHPVVPAGRGEPLPGVADQHRPAQGAARGDQGRAGGSPGHPVRPALARGSRRTGRPSRHRADHRRDGGSTGCGHQAAAPPPDLGQDRPAPTCTRRRTPG